LADPKQAAQQKKAERQRDIASLTKRTATPAQIQRKNSLFRGHSRRFRIVDFGGLNDEN